MHPQALNEAKKLDPDGGLISFAEIERFLDASQSFLENGANLKLTMGEHRRTVAPCDARRYVDREEKLVYELFNPFHS